MAVLWVSTWLHAQPVDPLTVGRTALQDGFFALAEEQGRELLSSKKIKTISQEETAERAILLLRALHGQNKLDEMEETLKRRGAIRDSLAADGHADFWSALVSYERGKPDETVALLGEFEARWPDSHVGASVLRLRGNAYLLLGEYREGAADFERYHTLYRDGDDGYRNRLDWGDALLHLNEYGRAAATFQELADLTNHPALALEGRFRLGVTLKRAGEPGKAADTLGALLKDDDVPSDIRVQASLPYAEILIQEARIEEAVQVLAQGFSMAQSEEHKATLRIELGKAMLACGRLDEAIPLLKAFILEATLDERAALLQLALSDALLDAKRYEEAVAEYGHHLETFDDKKAQARAYAGRGWALLGLGRYAEAATDFERASTLPVDPSERAACLQKMGDAYFSNEQYGLAIEAYERVCQEYPTNELVACATFQMGLAHVELDQPDQASTMFERVIRQFPTSECAETALLGLAEIQQTAEQWPLAIERFTQFLATSTNALLRSRALVGRGIARNHQQQPDALEDFDAAIALAPQADLTHQARYMRSMLLHRGGHKEQALGEALAFAHSQTNSTWAPRMHFWVAETRFNEGSYEDAEKLLEDFAQRYSTNSLAAVALFRAGVAAAKQHEYLRANEVLTRVAKEYADSDVVARARFEQANALCELGKYSAAILIYEEIINNYPDRDVVHLAWGRKGDCQFTLGTTDAKRYQESIVSFRVVTKATQASLDDVLQAEYKIGRAMQKLERPTEALDQYYARVMIPFLVARDEGKALNESAQLWFSRASMSAADIVEELGDLRRLVNILGRVADAGVAISGEARERITAIREDNWWLFY